MDIPSTGPTSLRSNYTDEDDGKDDLEDVVETPTHTSKVSASNSSKQERFAALVTKEELSSATLLILDSK